VAGIHALVNQKVGSRTGNPNPVYYALANAQFASTGSGGCDANKGNASDASCVFHDIRGLSVTLGGTTYTTGTAVPCLHDTPDCLTPSGSGTYGIISQSASSFSQAYPAGISWDYATGLGSINATNLVNNWPHDAATQLAFVVQPDANYAPGALIEVEVVAEDANGLPVDADVTLSLQGGDPTAVLSGSHCCNVNTSGGVATFDMSVDKPNMNYQLVATTGNLTTTSTAFTIATSNLKFTTQPASSTKAGDLFTTKISIVDGNGKVVTGSNAWIYLGLTGGAPGALLFDNVNVPASVVSIQAVNGVATVQRYATVAAKNYQIEAVSPGLNGASSNVFAVTAGTPTGIVFTAQPPTSWPASESFSTTVAVQDKFGNTVSPWNFSARVALYDASGTGQKTISGTLTQPMSTGTATFSGLSIATPGSYVLKVFSGSYTTTSTVINITAPASLVFDEQPPKTVNAGVPFEVKVAAVDASGVNKIASFNGPISLSLVGSGATLDGTTTVNAVSGEATVGGISVGTPGTYRLKANLTDTVVFSDSFTVTTAPTSITLKFSTVPAAVQAGSPFGVAVSTFDQANNLITTPTTIKLKLLGGGDLGGTLSGTLQAVTSGGTAQFNGLSINTAASYQLEASATGAVSATSGTLTVVPAAFSKLVFITQPVGILQDRPLSAIAVAEEDAFDNILTQDDTSSISFTVPACGGNVALGTATVSNGIALLSNSQIKFHMVASALQVTASTQGVSALSDPFAVAADIGLVYYGGFEGCQL